jgi:hypothetical protein
MDERKRFQFSVWNLMLMVALWSVLFWNARQNVQGGAGVWIGAVVIGIAPAIGALLAGWKGMRKGFGWFLVVYVIGLAVVGIVWGLAFLIQAVSVGALAEPGPWSLCAAAVMVSVLPAVGAIVSWRRGSEFWFDTAVVLAILSVFLVFIGCVAVFAVRVTLHR